MRKVGTITASLGFIYLGIWMIMRNVNVSAADKMFTWWPAIIVLLGIEILISYSIANRMEEVRFNFISVVVICIFIFVNLVQFTGNSLGEGVDWLNKNVKITDGIDFLNNINENNYKVLNSQVTLEGSGSILKLNTNNGDIRIKKSADRNIKIEASVFIDKNSKEDKYTINSKKEDTGYSIDMREGNIKKVQLYVNVPEGYTIDIDSDNLRIINENEVTNENYVIKAGNGSIDLSSANSLKLDLNNGSVKVRDIINVNVISNNASVNLDGNVEQVSMRANNGAININNKICKDIDVELKLGAVKLNTEDENITLEADVKRGPLDINGAKSFNTSVNTYTGNGAGKVKINVDNGAVTVKSQE